MKIKLVALVGLLSFSAAAYIYPTIEARPKTKVDIVFSGLKYLITRNAADTNKVTDIVLASLYATPNVPIGAGEVLWKMPYSGMTTKYYINKSTGAGSFIPYAKTVPQTTNHVQALPSVQIGFSQDSLKDLLTLSDIPAVHPEVAKRGAQFVSWDYWPPYNIMPPTNITIHAVWDK